MSGDLIKKFIGAVRKKGLLEKGEAILVAYSGGADSSALLDLLVRLRERWKLRIGAAHINHHLRGGDSDGDAAFCRSEADRLGIPFLSRSADVRQYVFHHGCSLEQAARILRYEALREIAEEHRYCKIATAHTRDDNAETFLMHLIKGGNWESLQAIPPLRDTVIRPLLWCSKEEIYAYLRRRGIECREDHSNRENIFLRNRIRNILIPDLERHFNSDIRKTLDRWSLIFRDLRDYVDSQADSKFEKYYHSGEDGALIIDMKGIQKFPTILQKALLRKILSFHGIIVSASHLDMLAGNGLAEMQTGKNISLSDGHSVLVDRGSLVVRTRPEAPYDFPVELGREYMFLNGRIFFKSGRVGNEDSGENWDEIIDAGGYAGRKLHLRTWRQGDVFYPFGGPGSKKVSDFFIDEKISSSRKGSIPIFTADDEIIWICGYRISEKARITDQTRLRWGLKCRYG